MTAGARIERLIVLGCGQAGTEHARAFRRLRPAGDIVCVGPGRSPADLARSVNGRATDAAEAFEHGGRAAAVVATPPNLHAELASAAMCRGLGVLVEKPLAPRPRTAAELCRMAHRAHVVLAVGHVMRCLQVFETLRRWILEGRLGTVLSWREQRLAFRPTLERRWWPTLETGLLGFQVIHAIDLVCWTLGSELRGHRSEFGPRSPVTGWHRHCRLFASTARGTEVEIHHSCQWL